VNSLASLGLPSVLSVISAMITPAILILATGSLVASTLTRLARVVDRARELLADIVAARDGGDEQRAATYARWLRAYQRRASFAERALQLYYVAIFLFVTASLSIAVEHLTRAVIPWFSLSVVLTGAAALCAGTAALVIETNIATGMLRAEIAETLGADWRSAVPDAVG
jgi:Na+-transporting methylmalonyl-CoA/oxaloacetate decarboxylase beta subunit